MSAAIEPHIERAIFDGAAIGVRDFYCSGQDGEGNIEIVDGAQLCVVRTGLFGYEARGREHIADANSVLFLRQGLEYRTRHPDGRADACTVFTIPEASLRTLTATPDEASEVGDVRWTVRAVSASAFREHWTLLRELAEDAGDPDRALSIEERALHFASELFSAPLPKGPPRLPRAATARVHRELVETVKELVASRVADRLPLVELAAEVGWSPFELSRVFRQRTGLPIHRYRRQLRLRTAFSRLADGESHIGNLALDLGFSTHSHFAEAFRSEFGVAPSVMRAHGAPTSGV